MTRNLLKNIMTIFLALIVSGTLSCCSDEKITEPSGTTTDNTKENSNSDYAFSFEISLDAISSNTTRVLNNNGSVRGEEYEDIVDIERKNYDFRVLFFDKYDNFLFEPKDYAIEPMPDYNYDVDNGTNTGVSSRRWLIKIPEYVLIREGAYKVIREDGFKVAVLANWPKAGYYDKVEDLSADNANITTNIEGRILQKAFTIKKGEKLYKLSHYWIDTFYGDTKYTGENLFGFLTKKDENDNPMMGAYSSWVTVNYNGQEDADDKIHFSHRKYTYKIVRKYNGDFSEHTYKHIWRVWNFENGTKEYMAGRRWDGSAYANENTSWPEDFQDFWEKHGDKENKLSSLGGISQLDNFGSLYEEENEADGLFYGKFVDDKSSELNAQRTTEGTIRLTWNATNGYLEVPEGSDGNGNSSNKFKSTQFLDGTTQLTREQSTYNNHGFHFRAYAAGTLRIVAKRSGDNGKLGIQIRKDYGTGNNNKNDRILIKSDGSESGSTSTLGKLSSSTIPNSNDNVITEENGKDVTLTKEFKTFTISNIAVTGEIDETVIPGEPLDIYIMSLDGGMHIAQIEYFEDKRLYDTDRQGIIVGDDVTVTDENNVPTTYNQLIPMYGIQEFLPIEQFLVSGETFNLSESTTINGHHYTSKRVHLLRSVAKVELYLPKDLNPSHIYMRSNNRDARCEPMDASTPTNIIWNGGEYNETYYSGVTNEIVNIQTYGSFYKENETSITEFQNKLSWFYGAWKDRNLRFYDEEGNLKIDDTWKFEWAGMPKFNADYPRVYNSRISRSDYTLFRKVENNNSQYAGYNRYILYVGEKNLEDPNTHGNMSSNPKVPHIEIRLKDINSDANLDDNDCYRIYFVQRQPEIGRDKYESFEKNDLQNYNPFPIMRNYIYRFVVRGINTTGSPDVNLQICTPAKRTVPTIYF